MTLSLITASIADPLSAYARDGRDVGTGATNPANGNGFGDPSGFNKPANPVGTVTTTLIAGSGNGGTPQVFTYNVVDSATGVDFDFQVTLTAFSNHSGSYAPTSRRAGAVDGPTNGENRNRTEFLAANGTSEYLRTAIDPDSIVVNSAGFNVSFIRWEEVNVSSVGAGVSGEIRPSGDTDEPGTGASLLDFSANGVQPLAASSATSIDWVPTAGGEAAGFQSKGYVLSFDVSQGPDPALEITEVTFDGTTATATWRSKPDQPYFVYFSSDLILWVELDDSFSSPTETATYTDMIADRFALDELPVPAQGFYRVEENSAP